MPKHLNIPKNCTGCTACVSICTVSAIEMEPDQEGFSYPKIDIKKCIECGQCAGVCPLKNHFPEEERNDFGTEIYALMNQNTEIRRKSSSGGAFFALASTFLALKSTACSGHVYGVSMTDDGLKAVHVEADSIEQLYRMLGSKYVQSDLVGVFCRIKKELENGEKVLFSGTPCQVAGLKRFLKKDYSSLYTIDFVCHGIPSPGVWKRYLREKTLSKRIKEISFRDKNVGWKDYSLALSFDDGTMMSKTVGEDPYLKAFVHNITIRKSCFNCKFRQLVRNSDLTLADCWGAENYLKEMNDNQGISAVIIHSEKGKNIFSMLDNIKTIKIDLKDFQRYNPSLTKQITKNDNRDYFFKKYVQENTEIERLLLECDSRRTFLNRIRNKINRMNNSKK